MSTGAHPVGQVLFATVVLGFCVAPLFGGQGNFRAPRSYKFGLDAYKYGLAAGDFNGDGKEDLVVADKYVLSVRLGAGDGTFGEPLNTTVPERKQIATGDFNGDGKLDLALAGYDVAIVLGNGDGTFTLGVAYATPNEFWTTISTADFNGDGKLDLSVSGAKTLAIFTGTGAGTFTGPTQLYVGTASARITGSVVGDFNGDNKADVSFGMYDLEVGFAGNVAVYSGNGDGTFSAPRLTSYTFDSQVVSLACGDVTGDISKDLVVTSDFSTAVLPGRGDGTFGPAVRHSIGAYARAAIIDLNADGRADVTLAQKPFPSQNGCADPDGFPGAVTVMLQSSVGALAPPIAYRIGTTDMLVLADFNGDGLPDVAAGSYSADSVFAVLLNRGDGQFTEPTRIPSGDKKVVTGDFNGDGRPDLLSSGCEANAFNIHLGNGDGTFVRAVKYGSGVADVRDMVVADYNGDGKLDVAFAHGTTLSVLIGHGDGTFAAPALRTLNYGVVTVSAADVTADGKLDLILGESPAINYYSLGVLPGNGDGTFGTERNEPLDSPALLVGEMNGDGKLDVVVGYASVGFSSTVDVGLGRGDGTFSWFETYVAQNPTPLAISDFDHDGINDVAVVGGATFVIVRGNGDGTLGPALFQTTAIVPEVARGRVAVADFTGDGRLDFADVTADLRLLAANGDVSFAVPETRFAVGSYCWAIAAADFNGDGKPDVAVAQADQSQITVVLNDPADPVPFGPPPGLRATATASSSVAVQWTAVQGAHHYELFRSSLNGSYSLVGSPAAPSFTDSGVSGGVTYLYKVRAVDGAGTASALTSPDAATTILFTDDPLSAGTVIKRVHLAELRLAVNAFAASAGIAGPAFTDPSPSSATCVKAVHILELRQRLNDARVAAGLPPQIYADPVAAGTLVRVSHFQEIRNGVK